VHNKSRWQIALKLTNQYGVENNFLHKKIIDILW